jgi:hypothetical protein
LEWQHLPVSWSRTPLTPFHTLISSLIVKGRLRARQLFGLDPDIVVPFTKTQVSWLFQSSEDWQVALADFPGQISFKLSSKQINPFLQK